MRSLLSLYLLLTVFLLACSPKTQEVKTAPPSKPKTTTPVQKERLTACTTFNDLDASKRDQAETAYVIYRDFLKADDLPQALAHWKTAYYLAPGSNGRVKYQFEDGVKIYSEMLAATSDEALQRAYADTIMAIYDKRVECFGDQAYIDGRKAFDYYYKFPQFSTPDQTFDLFRRAVDAKGVDADYFVINPFTKQVFDRVVDGSLSHDEGRRYAKTILAAIEKGKAYCKGSLCQAWETIESYAPARLEALEGIDGFYDCDYYTSKYYPLYLQDEENCETVELAYRRMLRGGCAADHAELAEVKQTKDTQCYTPPPPPGELRQGYDCYTNGNYACAVEKFQAYVDKSTDPEKKAKYLLLIAKIYYGDIKNFPQSRKYARAAAKVKPNWGDPYILIGKLYASSGPLCGPGTGFDSQIVTWPAIDAFNKAKKIDPSVSAEANMWIATYRKYMPSKEDLFLRSIKEGSSYTVGCWINERTTVRTP